MNLSIVIINYKSLELLRGCLDSIYSYPMDINFEVIVIDNNSSDPSLVKLEGDFSSVKFIYLPDNRGFAAGNNVGIKIARNDVILLLNPDTIVNENTLKYLFKKIMDDPKVGIVTPKIYYEDGSLQTKFLPKKIPTLWYLFLEIFYIDKIFRRNKWIDMYFNYAFNYDQEQEVEQVSGACLIVILKNYIVK